MSTAHELFQAIHRIGTPDPTRCDDCKHVWHGLPCTIVHCQCASSFVDRYQETA